MYEHHDAVLHAVREGVLIVGGDGRLLLANDEARRLLDLPPDAEGRHVSELPGLDRRTAELLASGRVATDEVHLAGDRLLAVNQRPTDRTAAPGDASRPCATPPSCGPCTGRAETARERLKLLYDAGRGHRHHPRRGAHRRGTGGGRGAPVRRLRHRRPGRPGAARARSRPVRAPTCAARPSAASGTTTPLRARPA